MQPTSPPPHFSSLSSQLRKHLAPEIVAQAEREAAASTPPPSGSHGEGAGAGGGVCSCLRGCDCQQLARCGTPLLHWQGTSACCFTVSTLTCLHAAYQPPHSRRRWHVALHACDPQRAGANGRSHSCHRPVAGPVTVPRAGPAGELVDCWLGCDAGLWHAALQLNCTLPQFQRQGTHTHTQCSASLPAAGPVLPGVKPLATHSWPAAVSSVACHSKEPARPAQAGCGPSSHPLLAPVPHHR